jgi:hypothetical protein
VILSNSIDYGSFYCMDLNLLIYFLEVDHILHNNPCKNIQKHDFFQNNMYLFGYPYTKV